MMNRAEIRIRFCDPSEAQLVFKAINPDNAPLPKGMELRCEVSGDELLVTVETVRPVESLLSTIDDLLNSIKLAETVICSDLKKGNV